MPFPLLALVAPVLPALKGFGRGFLKDWPRTLVTGLVVGSIAFGLGRCDGIADERLRAAEEAAAAQEKLIKRDAKAQVKASKELAAAQSRVEAVRQEQHDAIDRTPAESLSAVSGSRVCVVLRRQGASDATLAARGCPTRRAQAEAR